MCLVWCHGNPTGKWDHTHLVVPTRPVTIRDGLASAVFASASSFDSVEPGLSRSVAARRSFLVNQPSAWPDGSRIGEVMPTSLL